MNTSESSARRTYAGAYEAQYSTKNMLEALRLYATVLVDHPATRQARDARTQIRNITAQLAPGPEVVRSDLALALSHVAPDVPLWFRHMLRTPSPALRDEP